MPTFAKRLQRARKKAKLTQSALAEKVGSHRASVVRWERGADIPTAMTACRLALALDVSVVYLCGYVPEARRGEHLTPSELELLTLYRSLNAGQQALALDVIKEVRSTVARARS